MKKLELTLLLTVLLSMTGAWAQSSVDIDGISYTGIGSGVAVVKKSSGKYTGEVVIPETVNYNGTNYSVTMIYDEAFYNCTGLTSVSIPNTVTSIGRSAFSGCTGLTAINIPNSVTSIGAYAFYNTGIYNNSPDGVFYVGSWACDYKGTMPADADIIFNDGTIGIASSVFVSKSNLSSVTIPNTVSIIGSNAFLNCSNLTSVTIMNPMTSIGKDAFKGTGIYNNSEDGVYYVNNVACGYKGTMPSDASITLQEGTRGISIQAFSYQSNLKAVTIPNTVTTIGSSAFLNCTGLTSITIPNSVTTIGSSAFSNCTALASVTIPNSVTMIPVFNVSFYN